MIPKRDAVESPVAIDDALKAFIESGVSVVVGTRDEGLVPEIVRAWGPHVNRDRQTIRMCVPEATSIRTRTNLVGNGRIAVAFSLPSTYETVQLKGRHLRTTTPSAEDLLRLDRHRASFAALNESLGVPRARTEAFWRRELAGSPMFVTIHFAVHAIFNQTPGPAAGTPR
jgi:pyridoxamine 5'-phosphate oxidase-like protein